MSKITKSIGFLRFVNADVKELLRHQSDNINKALDLHADDPRLIKAIVFLLETINGLRLDQ